MKQTELQPSLFSVEGETIEKQHESTHSTLSPARPALGGGVVSVEQPSLLRASIIAEQIEAKAKNEVAATSVAKSVKVPRPIKLTLGPVAQPTPVTVPAATPTIAPVGSGLPAGKKLSKQEVWDELSAKTSEYIKYMEYCHAQDYAVKWVDEYFVHLQYLQGLYVLLVPLDREKVEGFRLAVRKEIMKVESEMHKLHDKIAVTIGDKLSDQALTLGLRHIRLYDQFEALSYALK